MSWTRWTPAMDTWVGTASDRVVAAKLGCGQKAVRNRRYKLGIPSHRESTEAHWTPEMDALLGTVIDREVAKQFRLSKGQVGWRRRRRGIAPFGNFGGISLTPESVALLGRVTDRTVAGLVGCDTGSIRSRRCALGIPAWCSQNRVLPVGMSRYDSEADLFYAHRRRHLRRGLKNTLTLEQWDDACEWFDDRCAYCGTRAFLTEDHLVPISRGGPRTVLNIIPACWECNYSKRATQAHLWIRRHFENHQEVVDRIVAYLMTVKEKYNG